MALVSLFMNQYYQSTVTILPPMSVGKGELASVAAALGAGNAGDSSINYVDILRSRWVGERLLRKTYNFQMGWGRFGSASPRTETLLDYLGKSTMDEGMEVLPSVMRVTRDMQSGVVTLSVETRSPMLSQQVAQDASALLQTYLSTQRQTKGGNKAKFIQGRLAEAQREYGRAEGDFEQFLISNRNFRMTPDPTIRLQGETLQADLLLRRQVVTELTLNLEQALQQEKDDTPVLSILDPGELPTDKSHPARLFLVLVVMILVGGMSWLRLNWESVRRRVGLAEHG